METLAFIFSCKALLLAFIFSWKTVLAIILGVIMTAMLIGSDTKDSHGSEIVLIFLIIYLRLFIEAVIFAFRHIQVTFGILCLIAALSLILLQIAKLKHSKEEPS